MPSESTSLPNIEEAETEDPSPRKVLDDGRTIYQSCLLLPGNGSSFLTDFGECRFMDEVHNDDIMPNQYRAPGVVLKMNWDCKVDIWSVAMLVRHLRLMLLSLISLKIHL